MGKSHFILRIAVFSLIFMISGIHAVKAGDAPTGIQFRNITFEQALEAAKTEHKPIFVHGYADWCHFCEYMKDSVYPKQEVGDFFNSNFICVRIDMEKEGKEMNKTLKAHTFPTYLFYDTNGELMHRAAGRRYRQPFMELGREALDPRRQMRTFKNKYESGTATPAETQFYFRMQEVAGMDAQLMLNDYLMKVSDADFLNANSWRIIYDILKDPTLPVMKRILGNKKAIEGTYTADSINNKLINLYNSYLTSFVQLLDSNGYEAAKKNILRTNGLDIAEKICAYGDLNKFKMKSDWESYKTAGKLFVEKYAMDDSRRLNDVAMILYQHFSGDKELMSAVEQWVQHSISISDSYKSNHLLASVQFMLGKKDAAMKSANHAIELAQRDHNDYSQTTQLIAVIQKAQ